MLRSESQAPKSKLPKLSTHSSLTSSLKLSTCIKRINRPTISSKSWVVATQSGRIIDSHNASEQREIASLTKIMTCIVCIEELMKNRRSFYEKVKVSHSSLKVVGTKADLLPFDSIKVWDLLHGLMLPSGNDAALALAEHAFIFKMNEFAKILGLEMTIFNNPHGLSGIKNLSTAKNCADLVRYALENTIFRKFITKKKHECLVFGPDGPRNIAWENTNKLLGKGFSGVKTGFTPNAGPCLACTCEKKGKKLVVVLLGAKSLGSRWREAVKLVKWGLRGD